MHASEKKIAPSTVILYLMFYIFYAFNSRLETVPVMLILLIPPKNTMEPKKKYNKFLKPRFDF